MITSLIESAYFVSTAPRWSTDIPHKWAWPRANPPRSFPNFAGCFVDPYSLVQCRARMCLPRCRAPKVTPKKRLGSESRSQGQTPHALAKCVRGEIPDLSLIFVVRACRETHPRIEVRDNATIRSIKFFCGLSKMQLPVSYIAPRSKRRTKALTVHRPH